MKGLLIVALIIALFSFRPVAGGKLYPRCAGWATHVSVPADGQEHEVDFLREMAADVNEMTLLCLAFIADLDTSKKEGQNPFCDKPSPDDPPITLSIQASGTGFTYSWPVDDIVGGSIQKASFMTKKPAKWRLMAKNYASNRCPMKLSFLINYAPVFKTTPTAINKPGLVFITPQTVYEGRDVLMAWKHVEPPSKKDVIKIIERDQKCEYDYKRDGTPYTGEDFIKPTNSPLLATYRLQKPNYLAFETRFKKPGSYQLCYRMASQNKFHFSAEIQVFGSNPAFFTIESGTGAHGEVTLKTPFTLRFHGDNLNSMENGDQAKLVEVKDSCAQGAPAGGVPLSTNLGPGDETNAKFTDWTLSLQYGGIFSICYKRKHYQDWTLVVNLDDLPSNGALTSPPSTDLPVLTNENGKPCDNAPPRQNAPGYSTVLQMTVGTSLVPMGWTAELAKFLCIESENIILLQMTPDQSTRTTLIIFDIVCNKFGEAHPCSGRDRKDMLLFQWQIDNPILAYHLQCKILKEIASPEGVVSIDSEVGPVPLPQKEPRNFAITAVVCLTLIAMIAMIIWGAVKWKSEQHHHIQIGTDDEAATGGSREVNA